MLKLFLLAVVSLHLALSESEIRPQTKALLSFTYNANSVAAYPAFTTIIYRPGTTVDYIAGATVIYITTTTITFLEETEIYRQNGPQIVPAGTDVTFPAGTQVAYGPGASVLYATSGETRYAEFNGNTHAIAGYPKTTSVQYYYGPRGNNLILFPPGANPLTFYNPGGSTQFGPSPLPVEKDPELEAPATPLPTDGTLTRTYGYRGGGYSYCRGYSYNGYPRTSYYNRNTGYRSSCSQNGPNNYSYSNNGGGSSGYGGGGGSGNGTSSSGNGTYNGGYGR